MKCPVFFLQIFFWKCLLVSNLTCVVKVHSAQSPLDNIQAFHVFIKLLKKLAFEVHVCRGALCSKSIAFVCSMSLLFFCTTCKLTVTDGLTLFVAREDKTTNLCLLIPRMSSGLSAIFSDVLCRHALSSGGHRFLLLWGARALFDLVLCCPSCSTDVCGCFHQPHREGNNQFRLCVLSSSLISRCDK